MREQGTEFSAEEAFPNRSFGTRRKQSRLEQMWFSLHPHDMSSIAQELDETLRLIDPQAAQRVERLVREILVLVKPSNAREDAGPSLLDLADRAEPMGVLTNAEIDQAIYGG